jgi:WD40 repeat protein/energy-coupling factor transporter ATP-binding protein EcfA2
MDRPFPGLRPFEFEDNAFFFGREDQVSALYRLLNRNRFIAVVGSSGSGKSSLVKAGLLPLIQQESDEADGRTWCRVTLHPGDAPMAALENALGALAAAQVDESEEDRQIRRERIGFALRRSSFGLANALDEIPNLSDKSILLVVDQFEEIFRYAGDEAVRFVQVLLEISRDRTHVVNVLLTMRADFIGDCARFYDLPEAVSAAQFLVPSLTRDQRDDVIRKPIEKAQATIDSTLVERLLNDARGENDQLPVLQHCLARLWESAKPSTSGEKRHLSQQDYEAVGQISGALSKHGNDVMNDLPDELKLAVEQLFRSLSKVDEEGRATRRTRLYGELVAESGLPEPDMRQVVNRFRADDCSFIVPSVEAIAVLENATRVDIVHEALLRKWEKISAVRDESLGGAQTGWLNAEAEDGRFYRALLALLERKSGQHATLPPEQVEDGYKFWTGLDESGRQTRPPKTAAWAQRYGGGYARVEQLLEDSRKKLEADRKLRRQAESARKSGRFAAAAWLVAVVAIAIVIWSVHLISAANAATKDANAATVDAKAQKAKANNLAYILTIKQRRLLVAERKAETKAQSATQNMQVARTQKAIAESATLLAQSSREQAFLEAGRQALVDDQNVSDAALYLGAAYKLSPNDPAVQELLPQALAELAVQPTNHSRTTTTDVHGIVHGIAVAALAFNPRAGSDEIASAGADGRVTMWNTSGKQIASSTIGSDASNPLTALAFDPHGRYVVTGAEDGAVSIWDAASSSELRPHKLSGHGGRINAIAIDPSGTSFATAGDDGKIVVWSAGGKPLGTWDPHGSAYANDVAFAGTSDNVVAAFSDGTLRAWSWKTKREKQLGEPDADALLHVAVNARGTLVAGGAADGNVLLYDLQNAKPIDVKRGGGEAIDALSFDPSGSHVVAASADGVGYVIDAGSGEYTSTLDAQPGAPAILDAAFNRSGTMLATTYADGSIALWTIDLGRASRIASFHAPTDPASPDKAVPAAAFSPDGELLATGGSDGRMLIWHPQTWLARANFSHGGSVEAMAFDPSGTHLLTGSRDGTAVLWRVGESLTKQATLRRSASWVTAVHFNDDESRALTEQDGAVNVWSVRGDPTLITSIPPTVERRRFTDAAFVPHTDEVFAIQTSAEPVPTYYPLAGRGTYWFNRWFVWPADGGKPILHEPDKAWFTEPRKVDFTDDGKYALLFSASASGSSQLANESVVRLPDGHPIGAVGEATAAAIAHRSGSYLFASGASNGTVDLWSVGGERLNRWPFPAQGSVTTLAFSGDDRFLAAAGNGDFAVRVLDVAQCEQHGRPPFLGDDPCQPFALLQGKEAVRSIRFSPEGAYILTTSADGSANLFDRRSGALVGTATLPGAAVSSASFSPNGSSIALGGSDGSVYLWPLHSPLATSAVVDDVLAHADVNNPDSNCLVSQAIRILRGSENGHAGANLRCD